VVAAGVAASLGVACAAESKVDAVVAGLAEEGRLRRRFFRFASPPAPGAGVIRAGYSSRLGLLITEESGLFEPR
jgi:hypothetical protein